MRRVRRRLRRSRRGWELHWRHYGPAGHWRRAGGMSFWLGRSFVQFNIHSRFCRDAERKRQRFWKDVRITQADQVNAGLEAEVRAALDAVESLAARLGKERPPEKKEEPRMAKDTVTINRAPVLTLWAAVVAERLGYDEDAALSFGKCLAGLNAQSKGRSLGLFGAPKGPERGGPPKKYGLGEEFWVTLCGRPLPAKKTPDGVRAVIKDKPIDPQGVRDYLDRAFGPELQKVRAAFAGLATSFTPEELDEQAYGLYERFRPAVQRGPAGWGQKGLLDLDLVKLLARKD